MKVCFHFNYVRQIRCIEINRWFIVIYIYVCLGDESKKKKTAKSKAKRNKVVAERVKLFKEFNQDGSP